MMAPEAVSGATGQPIEGAPSRDLRCAEHTAVEEGAMGTLQDWYHAFSIGGVVAIGLTLLAIRNQVKIMREQA
jgi:hypothetical protein